MTKENPVTTLVLAMSRYLGPVPLSTLHRRIAGFVTEGDASRWEMGKRFARAVTTRELHSGTLVTNADWVVGTAEQMAALASEDNEQQLRRRQ